MGSPICRALRVRLILVLLLGVLAAQSAGAQQVLTGAGSSWKYNDSGTDLQTAWRAPAYNDAAWPTGFAQLGYGDGGEATVLSYGGNTNNRRITYYFRRAFTVSNPAAIAALTLRFVRDDGCVIYLNGVEIVRSNMPTGTIGYTTLAPVAISGADESAFQQAPVDPSLLVAGNNVIAVELHQQAITSSDISFDLELLATQPATQAPAVTLLSPANHGVSNSASVTFTGTASAAALFSATLFVGGPPITATFSGPSQVQDAYISADQPSATSGTALSLNVDGQTPHAHGLIKFPSLIGPAGGQVPAGSIVVSASLRVNCTNSGQLMRLYRLTQDWVEDQATWAQRSTGNNWGAPGADGAASNAGVALNGDCTATGQRAFDITSFVQDWSNGAPHYGIVLVDSGTDGIDFDSSESTNSPLLTVVYKSAQQALQSQALSGSSSPVSFSETLSLGQTYFWNIRVTDSAGQQAWAPSDFELTLDASSPDAPVLVSPDNGSTAVPLPPPLSVAVSNPGPGPLSVRFDARPTAAPEFTIIALPDTQHYSEAFPEIFTAQTQWIVDKKDERNIVFVTHLGDIVEHASLESEWVDANFSMTILDNNDVKYGMGPGNHDQPTTLYNQYFPYTRYEGKPWYGGHYSNKNDNNYQLFSGGGMNFVIVHLEFCPPAAAVTWADSILKTYPNRIGIMTTHGYLGDAAARSVHGCTNTQYLWDGLAVPNPNLHFMISGHVHTEARRADTMNGHPVFQMLSDYQDRASGGEGWLRILRFVPAENKIYVQTYSPWLNRYETDADSEFTLDFPMGGVLTTLGTVAAPNDSTVSLAPTGLSPSTPYEWNVTVTNSQGKSRTSPTWSFTTGLPGGTNQPPVASSQSPSVSEDIATAILLSATDPDGNPLTYSVVTAPTHGSLSGTAPNLTYQPAANYNGPDSLTFRANDGLANSNLATVSISVLPANDAPTATGNSYSLPANSTLAVSAPGVLGNDTDVESAALTAVLVTGPAQGSLSLNPNGSFTYTPAAGYSGPDSFTYRASDGLLTSSVATVTLTVNPPPSVLSVTLNPASVTGGSNSTGTVTLTSAAPAGGVVVALSSNNTSVATVAVSVTVAANFSTATFTVSTLAVAGVTPVVITATSNGSANGNLTVNPPPSFNPIRVNSAGPAFTDAQARLWSADTGFSGGSVATVSGRAIANTVDDTLYQTERYGAFNYTFTVPPGSYQVTLKFAETHFTTGAASGQRQFNVAINGATVLTNFDIKSAAGGANIAVDRAFVVNAGAGSNNLQIQFIHLASQPDLPAVDAVEIISAGPTSPTIATQPASQTVIEGQTATFTVAANGSAPLSYQWRKGAVDIAGAVSSSYTTPPTSVADSGATFSVLVSNAAGGPVTSSTATLTVNPLTVTALSLNPASVTGGAPSTGTVTLNGAAPAGGVVVALSSSLISAATVPDTVTVPATATTAPFAIATSAVGAVTPVTISATYQVTRIATLTVHPAPSVSSITLSPATVTGGSSSTGTVTLSAAAPAGGALVTLSSSNTAAATAPASVTVAANAITATFTVNTLVVAGATPVTITATHNGSAGGNLTVNPPPSFTPIRVNSGGTAFTDSQARMWSADTGFSGGTAAAVAGRAIGGTVDDALYQNERWGVFTYTFTVPAGSYLVTLKFVETHFTTGAASGQRQFNVAINGTTVLTNFDIKSAAGGANTAVDRTFAVNAGAGSNNLQIQFIHVSGQPDDPKVDAIEIVSGGG